MLPSDLYLYLLDTETGVRIDLTMHPYQEFMLHKGNHSNRFKLLIAEEDLGEITKADLMLFTVSNAGGCIIINTNIPDGQQGRLQVINIRGQVKLNTVAYGKESVRFCPKAGLGVYIVTLTANGKKESAKVILTNTIYE